MKRAFTLVELLVSVTIFSIVITAIIAVFLTQHRKTIQVQEVSSLQTDAQVAFELLCWDLYMAGFGLGPTNTVIISGDGGTDHPDTIHIFGLSLGFELRETRFSVTTDFQPVETNVMRVRYFGGKDTVRNIKEGDYIFGINPDSREMVENIVGVLVESTSVNLADSTVTLILATPVSYKRGIIIIGIRNPSLWTQGVRYFIDENHVLLRNNVPFLENVEDIEFAYGIDGLSGSPDGEIDDDEWINDLGGISTDILFQNKFAIRVSLLVRSRGIPGFDYGRSVLQVENRVINLTPRERIFDRIILQRVVYPRNLNI